MQIIVFPLLGLSAIASGLPTSTTPQPVEARVIPPFKEVQAQQLQAFDIRAAAPAALGPRDARAATIFKSANVVGESTFIPANDYCTNISVVPGGFDGKIKSLSVEKGRKCNFYQEEGCGSNDFTGGGAVLEVGSRKYKDVRRQLRSWEGKIASVYCQKL